MAKTTKKRAAAKKERGSSVTEQGSRASARRSVIITFKRKDRRPNRSQDKIDILSEVVESEINFLDPAKMSGRSIAVPSSAAPETVGYDINEYEAPLVIASLTDREIEALKKNRNVAAVEEDGEMEALGVGGVSLRGVVADMGIHRLTGAHAAARDEAALKDQPTMTQSETVPAGVSLIKASAAWDCSRGRGIKVALLDTGIDSAHPDLAPNYKGGISFVPGEPNPVEPIGHSTHCAGTICAALNGTGVVGVAPAASLYAVKVISRTGIGQFSWAVAGIEWCIQNKMDVLNIAFGAAAAPAALEAICNFAWSKGLLLIAGAGSSGPGADTVGFPAKYKSVVAVSAIDNASLIAGFSSRGPKIELCAPGVNVLSTTNGGGFAIMSGTSRACAHASGAAALSWGAHRFADNATIRRLLAWTADDLGAPGRDPLYGFGRVNAERATCERKAPPHIPGIP